MIYIYLTKINLKISIFNFFPYYDYSFFSIESTLSLTIEISFSNFDL